MLSIERCNEILKDNGIKYNNKQIKEIRDFLYLFAEIQISAEKKLKEDEECNIIL